MKHSNYGRVAAWALVSSMAFQPAAPAFSATKKAPSPDVVTPNWGSVVLANNATIPTLQVVVNPLLERPEGASPSHSIHDAVFANLQALGANYVRFSTWYPYPNLDVAEVYPPHGGHTYWNFEHLDPMVEDFLQATSGQTSIINFSTIPEWMFSGGSSVGVPSAPNALVWDYEQGTSLRDHTYKEVAEYFARMAAWYNLGGFTDEYGQTHASGHFYNMPYWEILNEVEQEHATSPQEYTAIWNAVTQAIRAELPQMKFVGPALAWHGLSANYLRYFLTHADAPVDMISYHFYGFPSAGSVFNQADGFVEIASTIESMKHKVSPSTRTTVDELGTIGSQNAAQLGANYWNMSGAMYAYTFTKLALLGVDVVGESQLVGYPSQYPSVSMVNWNTGAPNARYWVLKLILDEMGDSRDWIETPSTSRNIFSQAFADSQGHQKILLVNKTAKPLPVVLSGLTGGETVRMVTDDVSGIQMGALQEESAGPSLELAGYGVAVVELN